jgi:hypothetical protein
MAGAWRIAIGVAVSLIAATSSQAGCWWYAPPTQYYAAPMYYYYAPSPRVIAVPDALPKSPNQTAEPPLQKGVKGGADRAPEIITTRAQTAGLTKDRLQIGFWNLTGRDITLTVGGTTRTLGKNRALTVELEREFSWQVDRLPEHIERVPDGKTAYEVVIRE